MNIIHKARKFESDIARTLGAAARSLVKAGPREPLEVAHAIVDAVERHVQLGGRGRRVFPFNSVTVSVVAATHEARTRFDAVLLEEPSLESRVSERLVRAGCDAAPVTVHVEYVSRAGKGWSDPDFSLSLAKNDRPAPSLAAPIEMPLPTIALSVTRGLAAAPDYSLSVRRVSFGRGHEVRDQRNRLLRTNDVAFADSGDEVNGSVSRQHAHIDFDNLSRTLRLHDDGSVHGTGIVRDGRTIAVPRGGNGVKLRTGDEIVLGEARLRVTIPD